MPLPRPLPALLCAVAAAAGCAVRLPSLPVVPLPAQSSEPRQRAEPASRAAASTPSPARSSGPVTAAPSALYLPEEALVDALSGPLEVVGVGGWPGSFRRLSCVYRNGRVFVVDERCSDPREPSSLVVHVLSPSRGRATVFGEAPGPIGSARRGDYKAFGAASAPPRDPPLPLDLSMGYEDVIAYETEPRGRVRGFCSAGTQRPEGSCQKGLPMTAAEYAARVGPFVSDPPAGWYELVRALVPLRVKAHVAVRPASLPLARLAAWGASWARDQEITVDEENMKRVGNGLGRSASIALAKDGGVWIAGTISNGGATVPGVVRVDASGAKRWQKALPERGFPTHEQASVLALPDGALVLSAGYDSPGWKPKARAIRLDEKGTVRWSWIGRGKDRYKIPIVVTAQSTDRGTIHLRGYIQLVADGDVHEWNGELDAKGKLVRDEVGPVLPDHGASFE